MKTKITVDQQACIACGTCWALDENHFIQASDGKAQVIDGKEDADPQPSKNVKECGNCKEAEASCPVDAIQVE